MAPSSTRPTSPIKKVGSKKSFFPAIFGRKNSKTVEAEVVASAKPEVETVAEAASCFYSVVHTFVNEEAANKFWALMGGMTEKDFAAMAEKHHALGFHNHQFLPSSPTGLVNCLWECKNPATTPEEFQAFIDGDDGPAPGVFVNKCYKVLPGAVTPTSFFADEAAKETPTMPTTGAFFWVYHDFKAGAADGFWQWISSLKPEDFGKMASKNNGLGFHNHSFLPLAAEGPCICLWEAQEPMDAAAFQKFIDGPDGPGAGAVFKNTVYTTMQGAVLPAAHFPVPNVVQHRLNTIPIKPGSMPQIQAIANTAAFRQQIASFDGLIRVDVLALDDSTMMTHSRWTNPSYGKAAAAALGKVLGGAIKEFVAGPPQPEIGTLAWSWVGLAPLAEGSPVVRVTSVDIKEGSFDELLAHVQGAVPQFEALDGLMGLEVVQVSATRMVVASKWNAKASLEAAAATIGSVMKGMAAQFAGAPNAAIGDVAWSFAMPTAEAAKSINICPPCGTPPDKVLGPVGTQAKMWVNKLPDGRQSMRIEIQRGFDWRKSIKPILPGCPDWCPATHFGYLESGSMRIRMKDGSERVINAGETYLVPPGHLPILTEDATMVEFSQDTTYTKDVNK